MPQMFPMNWFLFSIMLLLLMTFSSQSNSYTNNLSTGEDKILLKNMKWMW